MKIIQHCFFILIILVQGYALTAQSPIDKMTIDELENKVLSMYEQGKYEEAMPYALKSEEKTRQSPDSVKANSINNLAVIKYAMGHYEETEHLYKQILDIYERSLGKEHNFYAIGLNNLASLYKKMGHYELAERLYLQALDIRRKIFGEKDNRYAIGLGNLATLYLNMTRYDEAETLYLQALAIDKEVYGEKNANYAISLNNLAHLYVHTHRYTSAEKLFQQALNIDKKELGNRHPSCAVDLNNLAVVYERIGRFDQAETLLEEALSIRKESLSEQHPLYISSLNNMGNIYYKINDVNKAYDFYLAALCTNSKLHLPKHEEGKWKDSLPTAFYASAKDAFKSLQGFAQLFEKEASPQALAKLYLIAKIALQLSENQRNAFSEDTDKLRLMAEMNAWVAKAIGASQKVNMPQQQAFSDAFEYAEQNKSVLLMDATKAQRARAMSDLPDSLALAELMLQQELSKIKKNILNAKEDSLKSQLKSDLNSLQLRINDFKKGLEQKYPKYYQLKYAPNKTNVAQIQQLLPEKTAFLEYCITDSVIYLFYIDKQKTALYPLPIKRELLGIQVRQLRKQLSNYEWIRTNPDTAFIFYTETAHWFYEQLLEQALAKAQGIEQLIIVTDGELGHLPFEVFLTEMPVQIMPYGNLEYLIKKYKISYNYSAALWKENLSNVVEAQNGKTLAFACEYKKNDHLPSGTRAAHLLELRSTLNPLPSAEKEVKDLENMLSGTFLYANEANESIFKEKANQYNVLHLAMHGIVNKNEPILSSLAFTENGDFSEDNFLEAWEVSHLRLRSQLVVLSACQTGFGKFQQGEGVVSLARSFMYAGVPSLVVSLWEVNDISTAKLMKFFYENLSEGKDKAESLRQAKLKYLSLSKGISGHPAYWSAFIQLGDSCSIKLEPKSSGAWIPILAISGGVLLLLLIGIKIKNKG